MTLPGAALPGPTPTLVLLAAGPAPAVAGLQGQAGPALAAALGLHWSDPLNPLSPDEALAALVGVGPALVPLPRDPGQPLADGRHWAAALGPWRQPVLVLLAADQLQTGLPAALTALLAQWQVPCLGLVQWGGTWQPELRRLEGLPWLGGLEATSPPEVAADLRRVVAARWAGLDAQG